MTCEGCLTRANAVLFKKFNDAVRTVLAAPKEMMIAREEALHQKRARARKKKRATAG